MPEKFVLICACGTEANYKIGRVIRGGQGKANFAVSLNPNFLGLLKMSKNTEAASKVMISWSKSIIRILVWMMIDTLPGFSLAYLATRTTNFLFHIAIMSRSPWGPVRIVSAKGDLSTGGTFRNRWVRRPLRAAVLLRHGEYTSEHNSNKWTDHKSKENFHILIQKTINIRNLGGYSASIWTPLTYETDVRLHYCRCDCNHWVRPTKSSKFSLLGAEENQPHKLATVWLGHPLEQLYFGSVVTYYCVW